MVAAIDTNITAPAEISFINPILGSNSGCTKSDIFSTAVFIPSIPKTRATAKICNIH